MRVLFFSITLLFSQLALAESAEELAAKEKQLLAEEEAILKQATEITPTIKATDIPTEIPATVTPTETATSVPTTSSLMATPAPLTTTIPSPNCDSSKELEQAKNKIAKLTAELDETRSRLMIAETQVERLSSIVEKKAERDISVYSGSKKELVEKPEKSLSAEVDAPVAPHILTNTNTPIATVIVEEASLRTAAGKTNPVLMKVSYGTRLAVETRQGEWFRVISPTGARAWVEGSAIAFGSKGKQALPRESANTESDGRMPNPQTSVKRQLSEQEALDAEEEALRKLRNRSQ